MLAVECLTGHDPPSSAHLHSPLCCVRSARGASRRLPFNDREEECFGLQENCAVFLQRICKDYLREPVT